MIDKFSRFPQEMSDDDTEVFENRRKGVEEIAKVHIDTDPIYIDIGK